MIKVTVPATSANLGCGFDTYGLALDLSADFSFEIIESGLVIEGCDLAYQNEENLVYQACKRVYDKAQKPVPPLRITIDSSIPPARGLGSSSACYTAGVLGANALLKNLYSKDELFQIICDLEGHPDNAAACLYGGFQSSIKHNNTRKTCKLPVSDQLNFVVCSPDFELSTGIARSVLPDQVPMQDAIFNAKHLGMLIQAVNTADEKLMRVALKDRLHQPYREKLVPGMKEIMEAFKHEDGVLGCVLSGAGPSLLVISHKYDLDKIKSTVKEIWEAQNISVDIKTMKVEQQGATILE